MTGKICSLMEEFEHDQRIIGITHDDVVATFTVVDEVVGTGTPLHQLATRPRVRRLALGNELDAFDQGVTVDDGLALAESFDGPGENVHQTAFGAPGQPPWLHDAEASPRARSNAR